MEQRMVKLGALVDHEGQMRTTFGVDEMAELALMVYTRGLDEHQPIVAADNGDGTFRTISGHRRRTAALIAEMVRAEKGGKDGVTAEKMQEVVRKLATRTEKVIACAYCNSTELDRADDGDAYCLNCENWVDTVEVEREAASGAALMEIHRDLAEQYGDVEVPVFVFEGSSKEEMALLLGANTGHEKPDLAGLVKGYTAARKLGMSEKQIAAQTGDTVGHVKAILTLDKVPEALLVAVAEERFALGVASEVSRLRKQAQREGVAYRILEMNGCNVDEAKRIVDFVRDWAPPALSLDPDDRPYDRNRARAQAAAWDQAVKQDEAMAWYAVAHTHVGWSRLAYLMGYDTNDEAALFGKLCPECSCDTCQLRDILRRMPQIPRNQYPCQLVDAPGVCLNGVFSGDSFTLMVPRWWNDYKGVEETSWGWACKSAKNAEKALAAALADQEDEAGAQEKGVAAEDGAATSATDDQSSAVAEQIGLIASYMERHAKMSGAKHPCSTLCEHCQFKLDKSPVANDPDRPPCQWAKGRRNVEFKVRVPAEGKGPEIPFCRQYAPTRTWKETIPEHPAPPGVPREWLLGMIEIHVEHVERNAYSGNFHRLTCDFLHGRPMKASDSAKGWFKEHLDKESGDLSDGQLFQLLLWVQMGWMRAEGRTGGKYLMPLPTGQMVLYKEENWKV